MNMIRNNITGYGAGNGPFITIHDGFLNVGTWANYMNGSDRLVLDTHPYFAFDGQPNDEPLAVPEEGMITTAGASGGTWPQKACSAWQASINGSYVCSFTHTFCIHRLIYVSLHRQSAFGVTVAGEFSNAINDCGLYVNGVPGGASYKGDCTVFEEWQNWNDTMKDGFHEFMLASMDAMQNWYFWTWKVCSHTLLVVFPALLEC
jgi:glucan 1,3-beta-glucosidase